MNASVLTEAMVHPELAGLGAAVIGEYTGAAAHGLKNAPTEQFNNAARLISRHLIPVGLNQVLFAIDSALRATTEGE